MLHGPAPLCRRQSNASSRATAERGAAVPCQFYLSSWKLDQAAPGDCPRSSGIRASFIRASASSSPTCRARPIGLSPSTTSAGHASNGSRKARARSSGRGYRAERLWPTPCGSSFMRSLTISAISCARCDARANPGLIADELEGEADQDRRESGEPRPLRCLPDGGGRHPTANVPGDLAIDRGTTTAAATSVRVRRRFVTHSKAPDGRSTSKCHRK